jgi:hypothetical protein
MLCNNSIAHCKTIWPMRRLIGVAMPTTFHDREQAFEARFARDEEFRFVAAARRDKLLARWAATKLGLSDETTEALVKEVVAIPNGPDHDQALLQHVAAFLTARDAGVPEKDLSAVLGECMQQAVRQLTEMPPDRSDLI